MAKMIQNNFVGGEISPLLHSRSDLQVYYKGVARAENFVVSKEGSLKKRRGIASEATVARSFADVKLFPYTYDRTGAGILEFYLEEATVKACLRNKLSLDEPGEAVTVATLTENELAAFDIKQVRAVQIGDTFYATHKGVFSKRLVVDFAECALTVNDYEQASTPDAVDEVSCQAYDASGNPTTLYGRTYTYGAYVCKSGVLSEVKTGTCSFSTSWTAGYSIKITITHGLDLDEKDFDYIVLGKKSGSFFGELVRWYPEDVTETTVEFSDENHTAGDVIYSQTNVLGEDFKAPLIVNAYQQRLVFANAEAGGQNLPMTLWFSEIGNLYNFYADRPSSDDDPFSPTLMSTGPSFIRWLVPYQKAMIAFTDAGVFAIAGSQNEGFSAATCQITKLSNASVSQTVKPVETDDGIVFVGADGKTLYTMAYDLQTDSTRPVSRMFFSKHVTRFDAITSIALQSFPDQVIWCTLADGTLASFTFEDKQEVGAWARHEIPGVDILEAIGTNTVTDDSGDYTFGDVIFAAVETGTSDTYELCRFVAAYTDNVGLVEEPVQAYLETLPAESQESTIKGLAKNIKDVLVSFFESGPVKVRALGDATLPTQTLNPNATAANPFTGQAKVVPRGYLSEEGRLEFRSDTATPCEILGIVYKLEVGG